jgi:iron-sulfur cluster assembly accessory protein
MVPSFVSTRVSSSDSIVVTSAVVDRIKQLRKEDKNDNLYLRIVVDSGGCNGFLAKFELDTKAPAKDDIVVKKDGADVVLDELSMGLMKGSTIDYIDEMSRSTFVIVENPNAGTSCGCNTSFSLKEAK